MEKILLSLWCILMGIGFWESRIARTAPSRPIRPLNVPGPFEYWDFSWVSRWACKRFDNSNENRQSRVPRALFNKLAEVFYNETNAETLLDLYPCPKVHFKLFSAIFRWQKVSNWKKSGLIESARDECGDQATDWLTDWSWACIGRHAFNRFLSLTGKNDQPWLPFVLWRLLIGWNNDSWLVDSKW